MTQYFLHSSLQELCAALHVSRQPVETQKEMLEQLFDAPKDYVLRFYVHILKEYLNNGRVSWLIAMNF